MLNHDRRRELTAADAWGMLSCIPSDDRELWIRIGMALKSALGDNGFSLFDEWSAAAPNYSTVAARDVWRSFKIGAIGPGTLVHLAREHGWTPQDRKGAIPPPPAHKPAPKSNGRDTALYARELWLAADFRDKVVGTHPYSISKGIEWAAGAGRGKASGRVIGRAADCLIVPVRNVVTDKLQAVQCINAQGAKQTFGTLKGAAMLLGNTLEKQRFPWYVCEGWASAVSVVFHHQHGDGVCAAAFGKSNQDAAAEAIAQRHQPREIIILREADK